MKVAIIYDLKGSEKGIRAWVVDATNEQLKVLEKTNGKYVNGEDCWDDNILNICAALEDCGDPEIPVEWNMIWKDFEVDFPVKDVVHRVYLVGWY